MKYLLLLVAALTSGSPLLASSSSGCESCVCVCREIIPAIGEKMADAEKRLMTADLVRLIERYVSDTEVRAELRRVAATNATHATKHAALATAKFTDADRACYDRVMDYFNC
jgi:hypothetical protein